MTTSRGGSGTTQVAFNTSGTLLLVRSGSAPTAVLLYDFPTHHGQKGKRVTGPGAASTSPSGTTRPTERSLAPRLRSVLLHEQNVVAARWNPDPGRAGRLAVACGSQSVYLWSDEWVVEPDTEGEQRGGGDDEDLDTEVAVCVGVPARECRTHVVDTPVTDGARVFQRSSRRET